MQNKSKPQSRKYPPRPHRRGVKLVVYLLAVTSVLAVVVVLFVSNQPLISKSQVKSADFPVYLPTVAPDGYKLTENSVSVGGNTVTYSLGNPETSNSIAITVQPTPGRFKMTQLVEGASVKSFDVSSGVLYDLSTEGSYKYLLDTGDTLVFLTSKSRMDLATVKTIVENLTRVE